MRAIEIGEPGAPIVLRLTERPMPQPAKGEVLIRVAAAGVNRPDVQQRKGLYSPPPGASDIPGLEVAGEVVALGETVTIPRIGERICALVSGGGYAEFVAAPAVQCLPVPPTLGVDEGAALPETFFTVYLNVFERAALRPGETLLVHGGSSGIGTTAILLAKALGAVAIVTAGSDDKCKACLDLGADAAINYREKDFVAETLSLTKDKGADVILDMVGGPYLPRNVEAAAVDGRITVIGTQGGAKAEFDMHKMMRKRLKIMGSLLRPQSVENKGRLASALRRNVWPLFESGKLRAPPIYARFPLAEAWRAHELMESSEHIGKIVLEVAA